MTKKYVIHSDGSESKLLSEEERQKESDDLWKFILFVIGAGVTGWFLYDFTAAQDFSKFFRMAIVVIPSILVGILLAYLHLVIKIILGIAFGLGIIFGVGYWLYSIM